MEVTKDLATRVFTQLDEGITAYSIGQGELISLHSIDRIASAFRKFKNQVPLAKVRVSGWSSEMISNVYKWFQDYQVSLIETTQHVHGPIDTAFLNAQSVHFEKIRGVANRLRDDLIGDKEDVLNDGRPTINVNYDCIESGGVSARLNLEGSFSFAAFESHAKSHPTLWSAFSEFKNQLNTAIEDVIEHPDKARAWPSRVAQQVGIPRKGRVLIWTPGNLLALTKELSSFLLTGTVLGTCKYCPTPLDD